MEQNSTVAEFTLLGLTKSPEIQLLVFVLIFSFYMTVLPGNLLIIITIRSDPVLTATLYFFLGNLAFLDVSFSFVVAPKMLVDFLYEKKTNSYQGCITQLFFLHILGAGEMFYLVVMAFDHHIAISQLLCYATLMNHQVCYVLLLALWVGGCAHSIVQVALIMRLQFCGLNQLYDVPQIVKLACTYTFVVELLMVSYSGLLTLLSETKPFVGLFNYNFYFSSVLSK